MSPSAGPPRAPVVLGVDSSTQSTKVEARDASTGALVAVARAPHPPTTPPVSEHHPDAWWGALVTAVGQLDPGVRAVVRAISVAGQQHGLVVLDAHGAVVRPAKLWNDTTSSPQAAALREHFGAADLAAAVGSVPTASFTITKLAWLAAHEPEAFAAVRHVLLPHDWLTWRLTGERVTDRGDASGTGYWSPAADAYRFDVLDHIAGDLDWPSRVPEVAGPTDTIGRLTDEAATALGLSHDVVVGPGTGDNMAAALGLGLLPGDAVISLGTSGTVFAASARPAADPTGAVAGFADAAGAFLPLVCTLNATKVTETVARLLGRSLDELDELAGEATDTNVVLVPYLDGERTPERPQASGTLMGLRSDAQPADLALAAFRGVVCGLLDGLDALGAAGIDTAAGRLLLVGGGARSSTYRTTVATLAARRVSIPDTDELVAAGAARQAAAVLRGATTEEMRVVWPALDHVEVDPDDRIDAASVRDRYRAARDAAPHA